MNLGIPNFLGLSYICPLTPGGPTVYLSNPSTQTAALIFHWPGKVSSQHSPAQGDGHTWPFGVGVQQDLILGCRLRKSPVCCCLPSNSDTSIVLTKTMSSFSLSFLSSIRGLILRCKAMSVYLGTQAYLFQNTVFHKMYLSA